MKEEENKIKITCHRCNKAGIYKIKPKYCAYCGAIVQVYKDTQKK